MITKEIKTCNDLPVVHSSTFTIEELQTIKIDILHIYDKIDLNELELHKRDLILNKLKVLLGDKHY